jgi:hypothetical protein
VALTCTEVVQAAFAYVDDLSHVWCQWAEMELKHHNYRRAVQVLTRAVEEPDVTVAPKRLTDDERKVCASHLLLLEGGSRLLTASLTWTARLVIKCCTELIAAATRATETTLCDRSFADRTLPCLHRCGTSLRTYTDKCMALHAPPAQVPFCASHERDAMLSPCMLSPCSSHDLL